MPLGSLADSNFVLGNAQVAGLFPVVYCSDGFCDLTGFSRAEVMQRGCACSFLYGPDTSELVRQQIRKALDEHKEFKAELILYRKSGKALWHQLTSPSGSLCWTGHPPTHCLSSVPSLEPFLCPFLLSWAPSSHAALSRHSLPIFCSSNSEGGGEPPHVNVSDSHVCSLCSSALKLRPV